MRITPLDVRKQDFRKAVRGFDCDEVRAFLTTLADEYETVLVDNKQIRDTIMEQEDKISEYQTMERTLRDTLMTAEKLMQETRETANKEGDIIIQGAYQKAKFILEDCRVRTEELRREIVGLRREKETYLARFKGLAEAQISFIESHRNDFSELDKRLVHLADSVVDNSLDYEAKAERGISDKIADLAALPEEEALRYEQADPVQENPRMNDEQDMWRDYAPGIATQSEQATQPSRETPIASPQTPTSEPEALVNDVIALIDDEPVISDQEISPDMVSLAAMGIAVPAVVGFGEKPADEEADAITEVITAALSENPRQETVIST